MDAMNSSPMVYTRAMTNHTVPAEHLVPGAQILVDGDSMLATITSVDLDAETIHTNVGRVLGVRAGQEFTVVVDDHQKRIETLRYGVANREADVKAAHERAKANPTISTYWVQLDRAEWALADMRQQLRDAEAVSS